jgi:hypothetical protein
MHRHRTTKIRFFIDGEETADESAFWEAVERLCRAQPRLRARITPDEVRWTATPRGAALVSLLRAGRGTRR